jgi:hypothetical protein
LLLSDRRTYTSEQQFAPLVRHRQAIALRLGLVFDFATVGEGELTAHDLSKFAAVGLKLSWQTPPAKAERIAQRLFSTARAAGARAIVFDGDDDLCVLWPAVLEAADCCIKKHRFADDAAYARGYVGKSNLTDYVHRAYGIDFCQNQIPKTEPMSPDQASKIVLGWNIALDDKIHDLARKIGRDALSRARDTDIGCRASVGADKWIHGMRNAAITAMESMRDAYRVHAPTGRVSEEEYYDEMLRTRLTVSPFGYGELCWRDFEAVLCGSVLVKPDMSHADTWPDIFAPGETYIPVEWDFSNLREACEPYLRDEEARRRMAEAARTRLLETISPDSFIRRLDDTMRRARVT